MNDLDKTQTVLGTIYLVHCTINGTKPEQNRIDAMSLEDLFRFAERQKPSAIIGFALESSVCRNQYTSQAIAKALRRSLLYEKALNEVTSRLEAAGVWYMPLKRIILKDYYPVEAMREMSDHDILFDPSGVQDKKAIMKDLGYSAKPNAPAHHLVFTKPPVLNFEMHKTLFEPVAGNSLFQYYEDVRNRIIQYHGLECRFTPEDKSIYLCAHEFMHTNEGGTGLRTLLDRYLFLQEESLDMDYVNAQTRKLGIANFEVTSRALAIRLFEGEPLDAKQEKMLADRALSGAYGTMEQFLQSKMAQKKASKIGYMFQRVTVPFRRTDPLYICFAEQFPLFYEHKSLLLLLPVYRIIRRIFTGRLVAEIKGLARIKNTAAKQ